MAFVILYITWEPLEPSSTTPTTLQHRPSQKSTKFHRDVWHNIPLSNKNLSKRTLSQIALFRKMIFIRSNELPFCQSSPKEINFRTNVNFHNQNIPGFFFFLFSSFHRFFLFYFHHRGYCRRRRLRHRRHSCSKELFSPFILAFVCDYVFSSTLWCHHPIYSPE